jgi:hypothetical protein
MPDIIAALDEPAATKLVHAAETTIGTLSDSGSGSLGPFGASWNASGSFADGSIDLIAPDIVRIADCEVHYTLGLTISLDLGAILPEFCLPQICIWLPFVGTVCTPEICIDWPTISIPFSYSDMVKFTADFSIVPHLSGTEWLVDIVIVGIPSLELSAAAAAIILGIGAAASAILLAVPFIGPFLALAVGIITAAISIAGVTGLLGPILGAFVSGLTFTIYRQQKVFEVLPAALPLDPAVNITIDALNAGVVASDEDELVISADISP